TNVLALDALRAIGATESIAPLILVTSRMFESLHHSRLMDLARRVSASLGHAESWLREARESDRSTLEAGARRFALTLGRSVELALLIRHAQWSHDHEHDSRATEAARRFAQSGIDLIFETQDH
ncbi:MAG TPA: hypothetical protein VJW17_11100, partial [Pyrinomonadaceae bacterium]|nr:hypothetical protein [Pyrinomonadaceae bacterium]